MNVSPPAAIPSTPQKPRLTAPDFGQMPALLRELDRSVLFRMEIRQDEKTGESKWTKVPYQASGAKAKSTDPSTWTDFDSARRAYDGGRFDGVGFVFAPGDGITGIDLDHCVEDGVIEEWARAVIAEFDSYAEFSVSGTGVHIIVRGQVPDGLKGRRKGPVECYTQGRYFTLSGHRVPGTPAAVEPRQDRLTAFFRRVFPEPERPSPRPAASPAAATLGDRELLDKALSSQDGGKFARLWAGDTSDFAGDDSAADMSLACKLAFFWGCDAGAIDRMFRQSGLHRDKWDREDYRERTIGKALAMTTETYSPPGGEYARRVGTKPRAGSVRQASAPVAQPGDDWESPVPFGGGSLPPFPLQALPPTLREYVEEVAASRQIPVDMAAMTALSVLSVACARRCEIRIGDTHTEPLNTYTAVVMPPGSRKSGGQEDFAAPLRDYEQREHQSRFGEYARSKEKAKQEAMRLEALRQQIARSKDEIERRAMESEAEYLATNPSEVAELPRLLADDITMERLAGLLSEQEDNCIAILSAEGGLFGTIAGRYNNGAANLDIILKGHGGETCRVDRQGQAPKFVQRPTITIGLAVQPDVLQSLSDNASFRGRGLLGRFLYSIPQNLVGLRLYQNRAVDPDVRGRYEALLWHLLGLPSRATKDHPGARHRLHLRGVALEIWRQYYDDVEIKQAEGGPLSGISDWASKLAGAVARIAGCLHMARDPDHPAPWDIDVEPETVAAAWSIGEYLIPHALAAFREIGADKGVSLAQDILKWVPRHAEKQNVQAFSARDCHRNHQTVNAEQIAAALTTLCEHGYLRLQEQERTGAGRRPSPVYAIHPDLLAQERAPRKDKLP